MPLANFTALPALYTPSEVAGKLKVSRRSVYQWLTTGQLSGLKAGQSWRITEDALIVFMGRRRSPEVNGLRLPHVRSPNEKSGF